MVSSPDRDRSVDRNLLESASISGQKLENLGTIHGPASAIWRKPIRKKRSNKSPKGSILIDERRRFLGRRREEEKVRCDRMDLLSNLRNDGSVRFRIPVRLFPGFKTRFVVCFRFLFHIRKRSFFFLSSGALNQRFLFPNRDFPSPA